MTFVVAYTNKTLKFPLLFEEIEKGKVSKIIKFIPGQENSGFNPIFIPDGHDKTIAEFTLEEMPYCHRLNAFKKLCTYLKSNTVQLQQLDI